MANLNRKRSAVWNHFTVESLTIAKCSYCDRDDGRVSYSGGSTSNLMRHLKTKHVGVPIKKTRVVNDEDIDDPSDVPASTSASASPGTCRIVSEEAGPSSTSNLPKQMAITQYVGYCDYGNNISIEVCECPATEVLVFLLTGLKSNWKWPIGYLFVHLYKLN
ncbi:hypothetical protein ACI65C_004394 [Semiaphis heraclei]